MDTFNSVIFGSISAAVDVSTVDVSCRDILRGGTVGLSAIALAPSTGATELAPLWW